VTGFFHNPNIHPEKEYRRRLAEAEAVGRAMGFPLLHPRYHPGAWHQAVKGLESEPEGGLRCVVCFRLNLRAAARKACELGLPLFTTTLTLSPHKPSDRIMTIGNEAGEEFGVLFLAEDFKKRDGFKRSLDLSREMRLYRQHYCGCRYSLREELGA
jgi:predicted adenine nucleotide alpha hydrolase (AANH) superfamily ATPase